MNATILLLLLVAASGLSNSDSYSDGEVEISIPAGWSRAKGPHPSLEPYLIKGAPVVGNSVSQAKKKLLLEKDGYTLALAYRTGHASGAEGGRFIEAFNIPWLNPDQAWTCSGSFSKNTKSANEKLRFTNLLFNANDGRVRSVCGIPKDLNGKRWYAGFITTGGYFFDEDHGEDCESKVYSLTTSAKTPGQLPKPDDPKLQKIIQEAISIVNSIRYKRCAP